NCPTLEMAENNFFAYSGRKARVSAEIGGQDQVAEGEGRQSRTRSWTVKRSWNSLSSGQKARSNWPTGSGSSPAFHQIASRVTWPSPIHIFTWRLSAPTRCNGRG